MSDDWLDKLESCEEFIKPEVRLLIRILKSLERIEAVVCKPIKAEIQFDGGLKGMPGQETDTQTISATDLETDAAGNPVTLNPANITWAVDDPTLVTMTTNPDGSATFVATGKLGTCNVTATDNSVTPALVGTDTLTVVVGQAIKAALVFGTPTP